MSKPCAVALRSCSNVSLNSQLLQPAVTLGHHWNPFVIAGNQSRAQLQTPANKQAWNRDTFQAHREEEVNNTHKKKTIFSAN